VQYKYNSRKQTADKRERLGGRKYKKVDRTSPFLFFAFSRLGENRLMTENRDNDSRADRCAGAILRAVQEIVSYHTISGITSIFLI